jgi:hypothetical protein
MSFVNELFERLSKSTSASDVQVALSTLNNIQDPDHRIKAAQETIQLIQNYGQELLERSQYKNAAYQFFSGSQIIKNFLNEPELENQWLVSSAQALEHAAKDHISWEDLLGGAACMTISSLLRIITGDWNVNNHLDAFIKAHDFSVNQAATACLYIPYNLVSAINVTNPNPGLFQQASDFTERYLINTKPASMFIDGIRRALDVTQQMLMKSTKFPSIKANYKFDTDVIFGEEFTFSVEIENVGDGIASKLIVSIIIPTNVKTLSGQNKISIEELKPGSNTGANFTLVCPSGEGKEELLVDIPVSVEYKDILNNHNSLSLGSSIIPIRSEKKGTKLLIQLNDLKHDLKGLISSVEIGTNKEIESVINGMDTIIKMISNSITENIQRGEFQTADTGLIQLTNVQEFFTPLIDFLNQYQVSSNEIKESVKHLSVQTNDLLNTLKELDKKVQ